MLDSKLYQVEFSGDNSKELTINLIAESLYAQFDL